MSPEIELPKEKFTAQKKLAGAVAFYFQKFLSDAEAQNITLDDKHKMVNGSRRFLEEYKVLMGGVIPTPDQLEEFKNQVMTLGEHRMEKSELGTIDFIKTHKKEYGDGFDTDFLANSAYALLIKSYNRKEGGYLENMLKIYLGEMEYGVGKEADRDAEENAVASALLFEKASDDVIDSVYGNFPDRDTIIEFGAGSGKFSIKFLKKFPKALAKVTDKNKTTVDNVIKPNMINSGLIEGKDFEAKAVDMRDIVALKELAKELEGRKIFIHIGYILHENWELFLETLYSISEAFEGEDVVIAFSEVAMQDEITEEVPLGFYGLHYVTQDLIYRDELIAVADHYGFEMCRNENGEVIETVHNWVTKANPAGTRRKEVMNSTTYWIIKKTS